MQARREINRDDECHDADDSKGGLDLTALKFDLNDPKLFSKWVTILEIRNAKIAAERLYFDRLRQ